MFLQGLHHHLRIVKAHHAPVPSSSCPLLPLKYSLHPYVQGIPVCHFRQFLVLFALPEQYKVDRAGSQDPAHCSYSQCCAQNLIPKSVWFCRPNSPLNPNSFTSVWVHWLQWHCFWLHLFQWEDNQALQHYLYVIAVPTLRKCETGSAGTDLLTFWTVI